QVVSDASPLASVAGVSVPVTEPLAAPPTSANVTVTPLTGLLLASRTRTAGAVAPAPAVTPVWLVELVAMRFCALPALALAVNVTGLPPRPADVAVSVLLLVPAVVPSVQLLTDAIPDAFVATGLPLEENEPPP